MNRYQAFRLSFALCMITTAVNLPAPLYDALAARDGLGVGATAVAFACYVAGIMPVLLGLNGLADRVGRKPLILMALLLCLIATTLMLVAPGLWALAIARFLLGIGTAFTTAIASGYMQMLVGRHAQQTSTHYVTASTALGFGLGAAVTSVFILLAPSVTPPSFWLYLGAAGLALMMVITLPDATERSSGRAMRRLPAYPHGTLGYGLAILLAWATVGLVIAILPSTLKQHGLSAWSGFATFGVCSGGVLFQPWARKLPPHRATALGLCILPWAYGLIAWGAIEGYLAAVLAGTLAASSACYGFIYLGGLSGVLAIAKDIPNEASAGYFLMAYVGFSLPVVVTGVLVDALGHSAALTLFGGVLLAGVSVAGVLVKRSARDACEPRHTAG